MAHRADGIGCPRRSRGSRVESLCDSTVGSPHCASAAAVDKWAVDEVGGDWARLARGWTAHWDHFLARHSTVRTRVTHSPCATIAHMRRSTRAHTLTGWMSEVESTAWQQCYATRATVRFISLCTRQWTIFHTVSTPGHKRVYCVCNSEKRVGDRRQGVALHVNNTCGGEHNTAVTLSFGRNVSQYSIAAHCKHNPVRTAARPLHSLTRPLV